MHVHIVYCHPSEDSLTAEIRDAFIRGLDDCGKTHTISDLYRQGFKTDISESEYLRDAYYDNTLPLAADVLAEQRLINAADALVFIYPVFWTEAPAKLVGWFNRVWSFGFAYGCDGNLPNAASAAGGEAGGGRGGREDGGAGAGRGGAPGVVPMKTLDKVLVIACAGNTLEVLAEQGRLQSMETVMLGDRIYDRAKHREFILLGGTERSNVERREAMREQHLQTAYRLAEEL
ncbi:MAG: NAD(P)H-dependent oxidoreductase [Coriobacteriales bacterium]|jgi:NAD(P)H dehydrogenase (quinone)|nr:NAD(P)H-dependent oxidoreductase [Coriobacteriales bacterium]